MLKNFLSDRAGAIAVAAAIIAIPLLLAAAMAVDTGRIYMAKSKIQAALDAGALAAAATTAEEAERLELAHATYQANVGSLGKSIQPDYQIRDGSVAGEVEVPFDLTIAQAVGFDLANLNLTTEVRMAVSMPAEIALVLDYSSSMNSDGKWQAMRDAAVELVDVARGAGGDGALKFALVPFSRLVSVSLPQQYVLPEDGSRPWQGSGCTQDRPWPYNTQDSTPDPSDDQTKWQAMGGESGECEGAQSANLNILPLTTDLDRVRSQLQSMHPYKGTHIALGLAFGWHVLSPNPPFVEAKPYDSENLLKVLVLLSDGRHHVKAWGPDGRRSRKNGEENIKVMCERIKQKNVLLVTIAFDLESQDARDLLANCASSEQHFYNADTGLELSDAFSSIGKLITEKIYVSK